MDNISDDDSLSTTNSTSGVSYQPLKDPNIDSERSSLNIPSNSQSLHSLPDYLSESSQNLLGNDDDEVDADLEIISSKEFDHTEDTFTVTLVKPPVVVDNDRVEVESIQSNSGAFVDIRSSNSEENLLSEVSLLISCDLYPSPITSIVYYCFDY